MKNEFEIRRLLGDNYHLATTYDENKVTWKLFRKYKDDKLYFSEFNNEIMTSETHTEKDLLKFAKENYVYDFERLHIRKALVLSILCLVLCIFNMFLKNNFFRGIFYGMEFYLWVDLIVNSIAFNNNSKIRRKRSVEEFELRKKILKNKLDKNKVDDKNELH